jgi:hypothetical protein
VRIALVVVGAALAACGDNTPGDHVSTCPMISASTVVDRKIIGPAAPYTPDLSLAARDAELSHSIAARRAVAWDVVGRVLTPTPLGDPQLAAQFGGTEPEIPAWHTWYGHDDFERVFEEQYRALTPAQRHARAPIDPDAGLAWNATALDGDPNWPESRYLAYLAAIDSSDTANGIGEANRVGYSPGAMRHLLASYQKQYACREGTDPPPEAPDPTRDEVPVVQRQDLMVGACSLQTAGPFIAGDGGVTVTATGGDQLYVRRGSAPTTTDYDCTSTDGACSVDGSADIYIGVFAAEAQPVSVDVAYTATDVVDPTCLDGEMPRDAVLVKAEWLRHFDGDELPTFDTSGARMTERLAGEQAWDPDGSAAADEDHIYTVSPASGGTFQLDGLHIISKELDHWLWITLWWSADPDTDFGADRPASIAALPGPWGNYKMCVTSSYIDQDPDPRGGFAGTLGDALAAVHPAAGEPTWCSNPYIEQGDGNAATNCIGCHQQGGTSLTPESILADHPLHGTTRERNNFFTDYLWAIKGGGGEDLSAVVQYEIQYWDANDPPTSQSRSPREASTRR